MFDLFSESGNSTVRSWSRLMFSWSWSRKIWTRSSSSSSLAISSCKVVRSIFFNTGAETFLTGFAEYCFRAGGSGCWASTSSGSLSASAPPFSLTVKWESPLVVTFESRSSSDKAAIIRESSSKSSPSSSKSLNSSLNSPGSSSWSYVVLRMRSGWGAGGVSGMSGIGVMGSDSLISGKISMMAAIWECMKSSEVVLPEDSWRFIISSSAIHCP